MADGQKGTRVGLDEGKKRGTRGARGEQEGRGEREPCAAQVGGGLEWPACEAAFQSTGSEGAIELLNCRFAACTSTEQAPVRLPRVHAGLKALWACIA